MYFIWVQIVKLHFGLLIVIMIICPENCFTFLSQHYIGLVREG